jgi:cytoskeletal protein CcmA (bactofilin family)
MKKSLLLAVLLIAGTLLAAADGGKTVVVQAGATRTGNINAFHSFLDISGKVDASVFLVGGRLRLGGEISGDVICLGSQVDIQEGAVIGRDLIVIGGRMAKAPGCRINGDSYYVRTREDLKKITRTLLPFLPLGGGLNFFRILKIVFWFILALLCLAVLPAQVGRAAGLLDRSLLRTGWLGLLALVVFILALLISIVLSLVLIGIPLLLALVALYFLLLIFGRTVVFYAIGARLAALFKIRHNAIVFVVLGTVVYALLKIVPFFAAPLLIVMDIFAIGIGVGYFLKYKGLGSRV